MRVKLLLFPEEINFITFKEPFGLVLRQNWQFQQRLAKVGYITLKEPYYGPTFGI